MKKQVRSVEETIEELKIQLHLLKKSCQEFDAGDIHEVRNIARALRVILTGDDKGDSSLFERAGKANQSLPDTRMLTHPRNLAPEFSLLGFVFGPQTIGPRAFLDDAGSNGNVPFRDWLEQVVCDDKDGNSFSRHRLIKAVANSGGSTHFPSDVRSYFAKLADTSVEAGVAGKKASIVLRDLEKHSLRQIAFEVLKALDETDGRGVRAEPGAILIRSTTMIIYPGREVRTAIDMKTKKNQAPFSSVKPHGLDWWSGLIIKLPYEGTARNAQCPCLSGLRFKQCCATARTFDAAFINDFEKKHGLTDYVPKFN